MRSSKLNRREFLWLAGAGTASLAAGCSGWPVPASSESSSASRIVLSMGMSAESILPGPATQVMKFHGKMVTGSECTSLQIPPGSYIGPLIRTRQNEVLDIEVKNDLDEMSVVHWHGLDNPPQFDGHPQQAVKAHSAYKVRLPIVNRAGTYWYHPHPDKRTGIQVYSGLIGMIVVSDEEEQALALPRLEYDVPLILQDRTFGAANEIIYRMDMPNGMLGDDFLLNGGYFDPDLVAPNERIRLGDFEVWEFVFNNPSGKQHIAHPIHIHGPQFQVLERTIDRSRRQGWESVRAGYTDEGWKDTFLLMPGEGIRILIRFHRYAGMSMYHCHNLEHEDMGMMRNLSILDKV